MAERAQGRTVPRIGPPRRNPPAGDDRAPPALRQPSAGFGSSGRHPDYSGCDRRADAGDVASGAFPAADRHTDRVAHAVRDADAESDLHADGYLYANRYGDADRHTDPYCDVDRHADAD